MANGKTKLTFAVDYTTRDGQEFKQGDTKDVDFSTARNLIANGVAAEAKPSKSTAASADK